MREVYGRLRPCRRSHDATSASADRTCSPRILCLPAADVALDAAVLDRIDEIVRPSVDLNPADTSYGEHLLEPAVRRRE
jgi:hypothetical protein